MESKLLTDIMEELKEVNRNLSTLINLQRENVPVTQTPWPVHLINEIQSGEDDDGNGLVYGHDFSIDENPSSAPPIFQATMIQLEKAQKHLPKQITWEQYVESLPSGSLKDRVAKFVSIAGTRKNLMKNLNE